MSIYKVLDIYGNDPLSLDILENMKQYEGVCFTNFNQSISRLPSNIKFISLSHNYNIDEHNLHNLPYSLLGISFYANKEPTILQYCEYLPYGLKKVFITGNCNLTHDFYIRLMNILPNSIENIYINSTMYSIKNKEIININNSKIISENVKNTIRNYLT